MRIAAIYDIHANLPALEAVIGKIRQEEVDGVVVGGDVLPGPMPLETLERLQDLDVPVRFIYGNGEVAVLEQLAGRDSFAGQPSSSIRNTSDFWRRGPKLSASICRD
jgi:predicted phosphodiesterase